MRAFGERRRLVAAAAYFAACEKVNIDSLAAYCFLLVSSSFIVVGRGVPYSYSYSLSSYILATAVSVAVAVAVAVISIRIRLSVRSFVRI